MRITEKLGMDMEGLIANGPITIVAFGDSVTHGAVGAGEIDYETVYWNRLRQMLNERRNYVPVNVINAGIGGINAKMSLARMQRQVLDHHPDLLIVCFGLNDVNGPLEEYLSSLEEIFRRSREAGVETVFMTPNMLNTQVSPDTEEKYLSYAAKTADYQNSGRMDLYMGKAVELAEKMQIKVCNCYEKWKEMCKETGSNPYLANRINHPTKEMHQLFAQMLYDCIFEENIASSAGMESTMTREA